MLFVMCCLLLLCLGCVCVLVVLACCCLLCDVFFVVCYALFCMNHCTDPMPDRLDCVVCGFMKLCRPLRFMVAGRG